MPCLIGVTAGFYGIIDATFNYPAILVGQSQTESNYYVYSVQVGNNTDVTVGAPGFVSKTVNTGTMADLYDKAIYQEVLLTASSTTGGGGNGGCSIGEAARGGPHSPEVKFLREIRDNTLLKTRIGKNLFETFYSTYYKFSSPIVEEMHKNQHFKHAAGWAIVSPLLMYYKLIVTRPNVEDCTNIPSPVKEYFENLSKDMDDWLKLIPLPMEFESISSEEAAFEISVVLRLVLRKKVDRQKYLRKLTERRVLPLKDKGKVLSQINEKLTHDKISVEDRKLILGNVD